jgi:hypothetical protein
VGILRGFKGDMSQDFEIIMRQSEITTEDALDVTTRKSWCAVD